MSIYNTRQSDLNVLSSDLKGLRQWDTSTNIDKLRTAINAVYEQAIRRKHEGLWDAYVLSAQVEYEKNPNDVSINDYHGKKIRRIKVIAHVPTLDAALPYPKLIGHVEEMSDSDKWLLAMHRVFYSTGNENKCVPSIGDRILVDFEDRGNHMYGIYKGIRESGVGSIPDDPEAEIASGKVQSYFKNNKRNINLLCSYTPAPESANQEARDTRAASLIGVPAMVVAAINGSEG